MKVAFFIGSPKKDGETHRLANLLATQLHSAEIKTDLVCLYDEEIAPCNECGSCSNSNNLECILSDGMKNLYQKMEEADVLVFGTPVFWFGVSGRMKLMIDRFKPYFVSKKLYGKKAALLLPNSYEDDNHLTVDQFKRVFKALGMEYIDAISIKVNDSVERVGEENIHNVIIDLKDKILENQHDIM